MTTAVDERVEVVLDVDLDAIVPCTVTQQGCPNEAAWALLHSCGHEMRACQQHHDGMNEAVIIMALDDYEPGCWFCLLPIPTPIQWRPL